MECCSRRLLLGFFFVSQNFGRPLLIAPIYTASDGNDSAIIFSPTRGKEMSQIHIFHQGVLNASRR